MISFRFHLLSITAVFLALAVGIAIGATVVDRATVDALQNRLDTVASRVKNTDARNAQLRGDLDQWGKFSDQVGDELVAGRLAGTRVLVLAVRGLDKGTLDRFRQSLVAGGAELQGTVWFTSKLLLDKPNDVNTLSQLLGLANTQPDDLRKAVVSRLASSWAGSGEANPLPVLLTSAFLEFEAPTAAPVDPSNVPRSQTRFVVASGPKPDVPNDQLAVPLATELARSFPVRVLAAEPGGPVTKDTPIPFVATLRQNNAVASLLSSVDNMADYRGRVASVLAIADFGRGKVGHYGTEARATRLVPESAP
jgi:hypothetical protein